MNKTLIWLFEKIYKIKKTSQTDKAKQNKKKLVESGKKWGTPLLKLTNLKNRTSRN